MRLLGALLVTLALAVGPAAAAGDPDCKKDRGFHHGIDIAMKCGTPLHARKVFVEPGDRFRKWQKLALASDDAAPDGCHLHLEKRALGGELSTAVTPRKLLRLRPKP